VVDATNREIRVLDSLGIPENDRFELAWTVSKILILFTFLRYFFITDYVVLLDNWPTETHMYCNKTESHRNKMAGLST
jgi:hypothetical protein